MDVNHFYGVLICKFGKIPKLCVSKKHARNTAFLHLFDVLEGKIFVWGDEQNVVKFNPVFSPVMFYELEIIEMNEECFPRPSCHPECKFSEIIS
nr:hypothetical protein [Methanosarcina mazei]